MLDERFDDDGEIALLRAGDSGGMTESRDAVIQLLGDSSRLGTNDGLEAEVEAEVEVEAEAEAEVRVNGLRRMCVMCGEWLD